MNPVISILIPAYNSEATIKKTVRSVLREKKVPLECIVIDDYSSDRTLSVLMQVRDPRLKIIRRSYQSGRPNIPRNDGINLARGEFVLFLDADDVLSLNYINLMIQLFKKFPNYDVISGIRKSINGSNFEISTVNSDSFFIWPVPRFLFWIKNVLTLSGTTIRSSLVKKNKFKTSGALEDWDLWLRLSQMGFVIGICSSFKVGYRRSFDSISPMAHRQLFRVVRFMNEKLSQTRFTKFRLFIIPISIFFYICIGIILRIIEI
jgi:glycosyltransferase involved in cell wall biosynthesis